MDYEDFDGDATTVDLRAHHVLGGVLHFNLLQMPPQPKIIKGWTITQRICFDIAMIDRTIIALVSNQVCCNFFALSSASVSLSVCDRLKVKYPKFLFSCTLNRSMRPRLKVEMVKVTLFRCTVWLD